MSDDSIILCIIYSGLQKLLYAMHVIQKFILTFSFMFWKKNLDVEGLILRQREHQTKIMDDHSRIMRYSWKKYRLDTRILYRNYRVIWNKWAKISRLQHNKLFIIRTYYIYERTLWWSTSIWEKCYRDLFYTWSHFFY